MNEQSANAVPTYFEAQGETVRDRLVDALRTDLLGPESPEEVLNQSPSTRYLIGMLAPKGTRLAPVEDEDTESTIDENDGGETGPRVSQQLVPSSIGLSFIVDSNCDAVSVRASWGEYERIQQANAPTVEAEDAADIDPDADPVETASRKHVQHQWIRTPIEIKTLISLSDGRGQISISPRATVEWIVETLGNHSVVSVFLVNAEVAPEVGRPPDDSWLFQPGLSIEGKGPVFLPRSLNRSAPDTDPDLASADLLYRMRLQFAVGHGVAVGWDVDTQSIGQANRVYTTAIPSKEIPLVTGPTDVQALSMDLLGQAESVDDMRIQLEPLLGAYEDWILGQKALARTVSHPDDEVATDHIVAQEQSLRRMRAGLECLSEQRAFEAFRFANRAMAMQRRASERVLRKRREGLVLRDEQIPAQWRPFQVGFLLQVLTSLVHPMHPDREVADLLWYPTAGGKTEAYLGLTAFTFALRRLQSNDSQYDLSSGTAVLMRYTLRLLTIQQFQRALALVCACEQIRLEDTGKWGDERFTVGLWVGQSVTPNSYKQSEEALDRLKSGERMSGRSPFQIVNCPWCGSDVTPANYVTDPALQRTLIKCPNGKCPFGAPNAEFGLPALVVDDEIYREPPTLLLATVDKFAQMAWNGRIRALFGRVDRRCPRHGYLGEGEKHPARHHETSAYPATVVEKVTNPLAPPDLIIQDELHLISGPMGSLVGIYESVIDGMSTRMSDNVPIRSKIVASTATVRRARSQIGALFDRGTSIFPALGLDAADSFFAKEEVEKPGRLYVGIYGPGRSIKTTLVRTYSALLSRASFEFNRAMTFDPKSEEVDVADAYMTLIGYFNSLRELGGVLRLLDDDVPARLRVLQKRGFGPERRLFEKDKELTSRRGSSEVADILGALDRTFKSPKAGTYPIDVLLASNMISVGVDIDRLGLMVVSAQPKTSAEYIQATSRVGRKYPGLIVEVYNWVRPRDISHYERFSHYHDTFYRDVEATSVTPFSERARDRALAGVLASFVRQDVPRMAQPNTAADRFDNSASKVSDIVELIRDRAIRVTGSEVAGADTELRLSSLASDWHRWAQLDKGLIYSADRWGSANQSEESTVLLRRMEQAEGKGEWPVANSLREVEEEVDVVLLQDWED